MADVEKKTRKKKQAKKGRAVSQSPCGATELGDVAEMQKGLEMSG